MRMGEVGRMGGKIGKRAEMLKMLGRGFRGPYLWLMKMRLFA